MRMKTAYRLMEDAEVTANLLNNKGYKLASDQEGMAFWKKLTGDYFRYAFEAANIILAIK